MLWGSLKYVFHILNISLISLKGSQFLRAYVERCNNPPVYNLISIGGQHQGTKDVFSHWEPPICTIFEIDTLVGVYGFPKCPGVNYTICEYVRELLDMGAYESWIQAFLVQAEYWHVWSVVVFFYILRILLMKQSTSRIVFSCLTSTTKETLRTRLTRTTSCP